MAKKTTIKAKNGHDYYVLVKFETGGWFVAASSSTKSGAKKQLSWVQKAYPSATKKKVVTAAEKNRLGAGYCDNP